MALSLPQKTPGESCSQRNNDSVMLSACFRSMVPMVLAQSPPVADPDSISGYATAADGLLRKGFGPRVRKLHARIGRAHHQAEGMPFSRALLAGEGSPAQLTALLRALAPAYAVLDEKAPTLALAMGASAIPWAALARSSALAHDLARLASFPATPVPAPAVEWLERLRILAEEAPHRFLAHGYVRYGGDLSGGQQLAAQANGILARHGLQALEFWVFDQPASILKAALHEGFEQLQLSDAQEEELLEESEFAFHATQRLLAELA